MVPRHVHTSAPQEQSSSPASSSTSHRRTAPLGPANLVNADILHGIAERRLADRGGTLSRPARRYVVCPTRSFTFFCATSTLIGCVHHTISSRPGFVRFACSLSKFPWL